MANFIRFIRYWNLIFYVNCLWSRQVVVKRGQNDFKKPFTTVAEIKKIPITGFFPIKRLPDKKYYRSPWYMYGCTKMLTDSHPHRQPNQQPSSTPPQLLLISGMPRKVLAWLQFLFFIYWIFWNKTLFDVGSALFVKY